ncbi:class I SAM-dependent methyltransferase [Hydrogenimonas thermophila]|uniref:Methyltransferase domain-containing protein n=1 Tax=Hydrogenimonas thermophila TaxID=223786 RepID=A0A1I5L8P0_9BACT|nr:class I SAM-dependent methyltransferase [Hydrogenimonas thermophila]WOE70108.1 class I SAM-dependent methyltransferase [Hydrogenimonas thermophila]WOE72625.1 class I SAM-dependent methyltransferase [Hydrogenimonas thermophila]SFO93719.1 Methyltransferase domain-containing protein [Hydrogenimonas thermophila]
MSFITFRRYYLDDLLLHTQFYGKVLDVGGKKENKRGKFRPPLDKVDSWKYLNIDKSTNPDYLCSADDIPVEDESFDIVLLAEVLEHIENPIEVLKECKRVLKENGKIVITMPFLYSKHADPYDFQRWTDYKLENEMKKLGFKEIVIIPMGSIFAVIYDLLYVSLGMASKNRNALKNRVINKLIMPLIAKIFMWLDNKYSYKSTTITTGYYIEAKK